MAIILLHDLMYILWEMKKKQFSPYNNNKNIGQWENNDMV